MTSGINRRNFVKYASGAAMAGLAGCSGGGSDSTGSDQTESSGGSGGSGGGESISWLAPAWAAREQQGTKFESVTGNSIEITNNNNSTVQQKMMSGGNENFDAVSHDTVLGPAFTTDNDYTAPVATSDLDGWQDGKISDLFLNPAERLSHLKGQTDKIQKFLWEDPEKKEKLKQPPHVFNFNGVGLNPKFVDTSVGSYGALFDEKYKGEVAMGSIPSISTNEVMGYLKSNGMIDARVGQLNNPTKDQIDTVVDFLVKQKKAGQFRSTWTSAGQSINLMSSEEAIIGDLWQPAVFAVRRSGTPCKYATMSKGEQGYQFWWGGIMPTKPGTGGQAKKDAVTSLIDDVHYSAWFPGFIQQWGYPTPNYPNKELVRDGSDDVGDGMGPEYYDWAYEGKKTYNAVDKPHLFDPKEYEWANEEGSPSADGQKRDQGSIEERIDRTALFQIWPDNADYLLDQWKNFRSA